MKSNVNEEKVTYNFLSRIIIKFRDSFNLPYPGMKETDDFFPQNDIIQLQYLLKLFPGIRINNLFTSLKPEKIIKFVDRARKLNPGYQPPNFSNYYVINCPADKNVNVLLKTLLKNENVELAYIENGSVAPPCVNASANPLSKFQRYLDPAPIGIDARYAWNFKGGDGEGNIKFIDIEQGWILDHEDIVVSRVPGTGINCKAFEDHGAAVLGIIMMQDNAIGGIGITPKAKGQVISQWRPDGSPNTADAIMTAIDHLDLGDILLLEAQALDSPMSSKFWPVEIQEAVFEVIRLATAIGIIVIEAAGNGNRSSTIGNDLDLFTDMYGKKVLNRSSVDFRESSAIIVAASSNNEQHARIKYSNYGSRIDCNASGEGVVTAGYFPGSSGTAINNYTRKFSGTSSASAILAGVAIAVQSITEANHDFRLMPVQMRNILSNELNGTATQNGHSIDEIGVMPDLRKIINNALKVTCKSYTRDKMGNNVDIQTDTLVKSPDISILSNQHIDQAKLS